MPGVDPRWIAKLFQRVPASAKKSAGSGLCALRLCRLADDQIDMADAGRFHALNRLRNRLDRAYAGQPLDQPADRAFTRMIQHFQMPRALPEALLEGFQWDAEGRTYTDLSDVHAYGARVAGAVGAMMTVLMDVRDGPIIARATDLGVACS